MERVDKLDLTKEILKVVAITSVLTATAIVAPAAIGAVGKLFLTYNKYDEDKSWQYRSRARRAITRLEKQGLVVTESKGKELLVKITQAGRRFVRRYDIEHPVIVRPKSWDFIWRVAVFDIPEEKREVRKMFRGWLKRLGFARLQQSVWVIPWPCREQFDNLCAEFKLGNQAILLETKTIAKQASLRKIFNL